MLCPFCYAVPGFFSGFAVVLLGKKELIVPLLLSVWCHVVFICLYLFLTVLCTGLGCKIMPCLGQTYKGEQP